MIVIKDHWEGGVIVELMFDDNALLAEDIGFFRRGDVFRYYHELTIGKERELAYTMLGPMFLFE